MKLDLILKDIEDEYSRENFARIKSYIADQPFLQGEWEFFEISFLGVVTNFSFKHSLKFRPTDIVQTSSIGPGVVQWNYQSFSNEFLSITTTGRVTVRAFVGAYRGASEI